MTNPKQTNNRAGPNKQATNSQLTTQAGAQADEEAEKAALLPLVLQAVYRCMNTKQGLQAANRSPEMFRQLCLSLQVP